MSLTISPLKQVSGVSLNSGSWKRRNSGDEDDHGNEEYKRARLNGQCYKFHLQSESSSNSSPSDSDRESIYSWQNQETEFARDTSDLSESCSNASIAGDQEQFTEYEPDSDFDATNHSIQSSSSDHEDFSGPIIYVEIFDDSERSADGSSDDSRSAYDSEISPTDYWHCLQCNEKKNNPWYSRCEKCFRRRKDTYYPPRPTRSKKRDNRICKKKEIDYNRDSTPERFISCDSGLGSSQASSQTSSQENPPLSVPESSTENTSLLRTTVSSLENNSVDTVDCVDSPIITNQLPRSLSTMSNELTDNSNNDNDNDKCNICHVNEKNGILVHGKDAHIHYCYTCSKKWWKQNKKCPVCARKVTNVVKAFYS